jgi:hypothetical protein
MPNSRKSLLTSDRLRELARQGADLTLKRLRAEIIAIERTFPELRLPQRRRAIRKTVRQASGRTQMMSAEARKAVSARMKKYWAERRKAQAKVK